MDMEEISAFSAYSTNKIPKKVDLKKKAKLKRKKKRKLQENNINSFMSSLMKKAEASELDTVNGKPRKKHAKKKHLIKSILKAQKESIFKDCSVMNKVDNIFLKQNGFSDQNTSSGNSEKNKDDSIKLKKSIKKKIKQKEESNFKKNKHILKEVEDNFFIKDKVVTENTSEQTGSGSFVISEKNSSMDVRENCKLPSLIQSDCVKVGEEVFSWMLSPISLSDFFENCWEQKPVHIQHNDENYFKCLCSLDDFKSALREHDMYFTKNIDVTSYTDGERKTENPDGKAKPALVWDFYKNGKSIRLLNPQTFISNVRVLNTSLQEFFHCFVGANIYLTPPGTQGFAPHYDDIEAFVLQLEGEKQWKLYNPRSPDEVLPRESSRNFKEHEIGEPILEITLKPGDLLYFPRGIIHQAKCLPHIHSLHITVSCYQRNSWADLLEKVLPVALQRAINENVEFRKGLPIGCFNSMGMIYSDQDSVLRQEIIKKFEELAQKVLDYCPLDAGVDQLGTNYIHDALPPFLTEEEKIYGANRNNKDENKNIFKLLKNSSETNLKVKLIRATCVRLVSEEEEMVLYYTTDNSLVYHEHEAFSFSISTQWAQGVEYLIRSYPNFVEVKNLPVSNKVNMPGKWKRIIEFVYFLWQKGLLLFDRPLLKP